MIVMNTRAEVDYKEDRDEDSEDKHRVMNVRKMETMVKIKTMVKMKTGMKKRKMKAVVKPSAGADFKNNKYR